LSERETVRKATQVLSASNRASIWKDILAEVKTSMAAKKYELLAKDSTNVYKLGILQILQTDCPGIEFGVCQEFGSTVSIPKSLIPSAETMMQRQRQVNQPKLDRIDQDLVAIEDLLTKEIQSSRDQMGSNRLGKLVEVVSSCLYMGIVHVVFTVFKCKCFNDSEHLPNGYLVLDPTLPCFQGEHTVIAAFSVLPCLMFYPAAVLSKPYFQMLDPDLDVTYDVNYIFTMIQLETAMSFFDAFFGDEVSLVLTVLADASMIAIFTFWRPCSIPVINECMQHGFHFSLVITIASLITKGTNDDTIGSVLLYIFVSAVLVWKAPLGRKKCANFVQSELQSEEPPIPQDQLEAQLE
jgi:hypothetical protein